MGHQIYNFLNQKLQRTIVDRMMSIAAILHPLMGMPQVVEIYSTQDVTGISLLTWFGFMTIGLVFLAYGILHRIKPLIVTQVLWFIVDGLVVIGVLLYR